MMEVPNFMQVAPLLHKSGAIGSGNIHVVVSSWAGVILLTGKKICHLSSLSKKRGYKIRASQKLKRPGCDHTL